jgi:ribosomal protein L29
MKKTQIQEIIKAGSSKIFAEIATLRLKITTLKLNAARGEVKNLRESKTLRRTIARLLTAQQQLIEVKDRS